MTVEDFRAYEVTDRFAVDDDGKPLTAWVIEGVIDGQKYAQMCGKALAEDRAAAEGWLRALALRPR